MISVKEQNLTCVYCDRDHIFCLQVNTGYVIYLTLLMIIMMMVLPAVNVNVANNTRCTEIQMLPDTSELAFITKIKWLIFGGGAFRRYRQIKTEHSKAHVNYFNWLTKFKCKICCMLSEVHCIVIPNICGLTQAISKYEQQLYWTKLCGWNLT